jgi:hypothetical protein
MDWIYKNDIAQVWREYLAEEQAAGLQTGGKQGHIDRWQK